MWSAKNKMWTSINHKITFGSQLNTNEVSCRSMITNRKRIFRFYVIWSTWQFINLPFCQFYVFSTCPLVTFLFYQFAVLSNRHFIQILFYQLAILSIVYFANFLFCQFYILATSHFVNFLFYLLAHFSSCFIKLLFHKLAIHELAILSTCSYELTITQLET
jgi:hypothetical protein